MISGFPSQRASNAENDSIWWRHHGTYAHCQWGKSGPDASWDRGKLRGYSDMASKIAGNSIIYSIVFQANIKGKIHNIGPLWLKFTGGCGFPLQRASDAESVSMSWHRHEILLKLIQIPRKPLRENHHASVVWNWYHSRCNRVFISAESVGRGWCKIAIATKWYQFHTTDKCGFLFMPWITDQLYISAIHKTSK